MYLDLFAKRLDLSDPTSPGQLPPISPVEPSRSGGRENPVFNLLDVVLTVVVAAVALFLCTMVGVMVLYAVRGPHAIDPKNLAGSALLFLPIQVVTYILTVGFMVFYVWTRYRTGFLEAIRWNMPVGKLAWGAAALGAALGLANAVLSVLLQRWTPKSLPIEQYLSTPASAYALAAFGILVAPVVEELFFRGLLYPALARPLGVVPAIALTAFGFALIHAPQLAHAWVPLLLLFAVGVVLTTVRAKTKSVAMCVLIHMAYNTTLFTMLYIGTEGFRHMERAS
ncbi:MAG TPA: CPBP family intramembrane glutamic endopeptidase [Candidatus Angelobacter sp.]